MKSNLFLKKKLTNKKKPYMINEKQYIKKKQLNNNRK